MREIKFRVWNKIEEKMVYYDEDCSSPDMTLNGVLIAHQDQSNVSYIYELMQYTGPKDNKEIYEDDIAKVLITNLEDEGEFLCKVAWDEKRTKFKLVELPPFKYGEDCGEIHYFEDVARIEIIGNIHQNPELLEKP